MIVSIYEIERNEFAPSHFETTYNMLNYYVPEQCPHGGSLYANWIQHDLH